MDILKQLQQIVGNEDASEDDAVLIAYARDQNYMFNEPQKPDYVVRVRNGNEIAAVLNLANENRIPVVPLAQGINIRGLCIPTRGGILLDMRSMNQIKEINPEMMTATIEPGVSVGQLVAACREFGIRPAIPGAPATVSAFANYMLRGVYHHNPQDGIDHVLTLEVILPTGLKIRTGSHALSTGYGPYCRYFGPDLTGLFMGVPGTLGVITEMTVKLYPLPEESQFFAYGFDTWERATEFSTELMRQKVPSLLWLMDWIVVAVIMGFKRKDVLSKKPMAKMPHCTVPVLIEGTKDEMELKLKLLEQAIKKIPPDRLVTDQGGPGIDPEEFLGGRNVVGMLKMGYLYCLAFFHPLGKGPEIFEAFKKDGIKNGFDPDIISLTSTPTISGPNNWSGQLTYSELELFVDPTEPGMIEKLRSFASDAIQTVIDGKVMYSFFRPYATVLDITLERVGETGIFLRQLKDLIDPNGIMNPGKFF